MVITVEQGPGELVIALPKCLSPPENYVPYTYSGNLVVMSEQISVGKGELTVGKLGRDLTIEDGQLAAKICALNMISHLKETCNGALERSARVEKQSGFVYSTQDFEAALKIINGASDLLFNTFGDKGGPASFAVCAHFLPRIAAVEVDEIFEIRKK